jgi:2-oxoglutarate ferredoxin oxidoreductase subunit alpha
MEERSAAVDDLLIGIAGSGGDGVVSAGESLMRALAVEGYYGLMTKSFGSQIRGGESSCRVRIGTSPVRSAGGTLDVAVALDWDDFLKFGAELPVSGQTAVLYDEQSGVAPDHLPLEGVRPVAAVAVPMTALAREAGSEKTRATVALGLLAGWFGVARHALLNGIRLKFARKGEEVVALNERAFEAGIAFAAAHPLAAAKRLAPPAARGRKWLADGNEMCAQAAIFAGCEFFGGYPITPSTEIMQTLSRDLWKFGGAVLQAEDEIAGVGAAVGASFAGRKAMTATSGPGMSLKTEMLGLATIAELPLVCVNVQRGGPATGMPTKSEQADLFQAVFSAHGDVVRPVLAPTGVADTFPVTVAAFNIAEALQTPVIVLSDQEIAQRKEILDPIDTSRVEIVQRLRPAGGELAGYTRFRLTESGVSPMSEPGLRGGEYLASGIEHTEAGAPTASGSVHARMTEKRFRKMRALHGRRDLFERRGRPDATLALVAWGSVAGVAYEALELAEDDGLDVQLLVPRLLYPVVPDVYRDFFARTHAGLVVEQSYQGQLYRLLRMFAEVPEGVRPFARPGSNPIAAVEIVDRLRAAALALQRSHGAALQPVE